MRLNKIPRENCDSIKLNDNFEIIEELINEMENRIERLEGRTGQRGRCE